MTGHDPDYGIKDYDIGYFDPDTSWDAEDRVIKAASAAFAPPLDALVEVRNQARVHLWFADRFGGEDYPPLSTTDEALSRFLCPAFSVGVRFEADDAISIAAPFGLEDVFAMRLRPKPDARLQGGGVRAGGRLRLRPLAATHRRASLTPRWRPPKRRKAGA